VALTQGRPNNIPKVAEHKSDGQENDLIESSGFSRANVKKVERDPSKPTKRIFDKTIQRNINVDQVPEYHKVKSILVTKRASLNPAIPHEMSDVEIVGQWKRT